jgi:hypothetical protein
MTNAENPDEMMDALTKKFVEYTEIRVIVGRAMIEAHKIRTSGRNFDEQVGPYTRLLDETTEKIQGLLDDRKTD